jgi:hypothetical protein
MLETRTCLQAMHRELFGFDIMVGDAALQEAVLSSRCLATRGPAARAPHQGEELEWTTVLALHSTYSLM